jgi:hypothetical protein
VAGSETTSSATTAILLQLVNNPEKLEYLTKEIRSSFSEDGDVTFAKLQELPYLNAVVWEGLRLMTAPAGNLLFIEPVFLLNIAIGLLRYTEEPTNISSYEIPAQASTFLL